MRALYLGPWLDKVIYFRYHVIPSEGPPQGEDDLPIGSITLWSMKNGPIPEGWAECDGIANAPGPDLRDRFVVGRSASRTVDTTGGSSTHGHTDGLGHSGTAVGDHPALAHSGTAVANHSNVSVPATATAGVKVGNAAANAAAQTHTHVIPSITHSVTQPSDHPAQSHTVTQPADHPPHAAVNHEPPYYVLIYIQRMS